MHTKRLPVDVFPQDICAAQGCGLTNASHGQGMHRFLPYSVAMEVSGLTGQPVTRDQMTRPS